jgi:hypothetical protein
MNKLPRLLVCLVLGSSSLAMAQPTPAPGAPTRIYGDDAPVYGDDAPIYRHEPGEGWHRRPTFPKFLGSGRLMFGRTKIAVSSPMGFHKLQLAATSGWLFIDKVTIVFGDGERQVVDLDARMGRYSAPITIDLEGRRARHIVAVKVTGRGSYRSMFALTGV